MLATYLLYIMLQTYSTLLSYKPEPCFLYNVTNLLYSTLLCLKPNPSKLSLRGQKMPSPS